MEETKIITLRVPQNVYTALKAIAHEENRSVSNLLCTIGIEKAKERLNVEKEVTTQ